MTPHRALAVLMVAVLTLSAGLRARQAPVQTPPTPTLPEPSSFDQELVEGELIVQGPNPLPRVRLRLETVSPQGFVGDYRSPEIDVVPGLDGRFRVRAPAGEHVVNARGVILPSGYAVAAFTLGTANLLERSVDLSQSKGAALRLVLRSTEVLSAVRVAGRVRFERAGSDRVVAVRLNSLRYALPLETPVRPDGTFEFVNVPPGQHFGEIRTTAVGVAAKPTFSVDVFDRDNGGLDFRLPAMKAVRLVVTHDRQDTSPYFSLSLTAPDVRPYAVEWLLEVRPTMLKSMTVQIPEGAHSVNPGLAAGYMISSLTYGDSDVLRDWRITIRPDDVAELRLAMRRR